MMRRWSALLVLACVHAAAQKPDEADVILRAMRDEMQRSRTLRIAGIEEAPYYFEYGLHDSEIVAGAASLGGLLRDTRTRLRVPRVQVRVGSYEFDNSNYVGADFYSGTRYDVGQFPVDDSYAALRQHLWLATDAAFKTAVQAMARKRAALKNVASSDQLPDFARAEPVRLLDTIPRGAVDEEAWRGRIRRLSAVFAKYPQVLSSEVDYQISQGAFYLVTSEGGEIRVPEQGLIIRARASSQASDGMWLRDWMVLHSADPQRAPSDLEIERALQQLGENLSALATAPLAETCTGPVVFEGLAAAQLFAEVLGRNLAVPRRPVSGPGQSLPFSPSELEARRGSRILPESFDVVDDPIQTEWHGQPLLGHYPVDLEGVRPTVVVLVEKGVLKNFLLTRQPIKGFSGSNGRARLPGSFGHKAASFGNLFIKPSQTVPTAELKKKLIELCRDRGKPYGMVIRKMDFPSSASFTEVRRLFSGMAQSGSRPVSLPLLAYRVYPDGREELVRGLRFRGLNARSLKDILAASDDAFAFHFHNNLAPFALMSASGFAADSSVVAPSVLIDDLELLKSEEEQLRPPIVPPPQLSLIR